MNLSLVVPGNRGPLPHGRGSLLAIAALCGLAGCTANFENENDRLRAELLSAEGRIGELERESAELRSQLEVASGAGQGGSLTAEEIAATPRVVELEISRFSRIEDGVATVWVVPRDGRGRFVQMVGELTVSVVRVAEEGMQEVGVARLTPMEVRNAYRSGFAGTHYFVEVSVAEAQIRAKGREVMAFACFSPANEGEVVVETGSRLLKR